MLNVIFFSPLGRSGSMLLHSLFDMHSEVIAIPWIYDEYDFSVNLDQSNEEIIDLFIQKFNQIFDNYEALRFGSMSEIYFKDKENMQITQIDKALYRKNFIELCNDNKISTQKMLFELINLAYAKTLGYDIGKIKYIFVHIHFLDYYKDFTEDKRYQFFAKNYPKMKVLFTIRDFRQVVSSSIKISMDYLDGSNFSMYKRAVFFNVTYLTLMANIVYHISAYHNTLLIDLNRLHVLGREAMQRISTFLEIKFTDSLCESTFLGQPYYGNSINCVKLQGFNGKMTNRGGDCLDKNTVILIELFQGNIMRSLRFENIKRLSFAKRIFGIFYFIYVFIRPIFLKLNKFDVEAISHIKDAKDIENIINSKHPKYLKYVKYKIILKIVKHNIRIFTLLYKNIILWKNCNGFKIWLRVYGINKKFRDVTIKDELFL